MSKRPAASKTKANTNGMFAVIENYLKTKILVKGKLKQPSELPTEIFNAIANNPAKYQQIYGILKTGRGNPLEKKIISCVKKILCKFGGGRERNGLVEFTRNVGEGIATGELSLFACTLLPLANLDLRELGFNQDSDIQKLLKRLINNSEYHAQFCELVTTFDLYHLIDCRESILALLPNKDATLLAAFLTKSDTEKLFIGIVEDRAKDYLNSKNFTSRNSSLNQFAKIVKTTLKLINRLDVLESSTDMHSICTLPELCWAMESIKKLESESDCNPNFDLKEIQKSYFDKIPSLVKSNKFLEKVVQDQIKYHSLHFLDSPDIYHGVDLTVKPSLEYYNSKSPITLINDKTPLSLNPHVIDLISLDCEWTNETCLATTQLSIDFTNGSRSTFILDMLNPPCGLGTTLSQLYNHNHWIGFESAQDFKKINALYPTLPPLPNRYTNIAVHPALLQMRLSGLSKVSQSILGLKVDKRPRLSNWNRRPLRRSQILYAAADAEILLDIYARLIKLVV